jgi:hypothetical protein
LSGTFVASKPALCEAMCHFFAQFATVFVPAVFGIFIGIIVWLQDASFSVLSIILIIQQ